MGERGMMNRRNSGDVTSKGDLDDELKGLRIADALSMFKFRKIKQPSKQEPQSNQRHGEKKPCESKQTKIDDESASSLTHVEETETEDGTETDLSSSLKAINIEPLGTKHR